MEKLLNKKNCTIIGMLASVALIVTGIVVLTSLFGNWNTSHVSSPYGGPTTTKYDYGYAVFGADFYNYVANNAALSGYGAQTAAGNLSEIFEMLRFSIGVFMICFGLGSLGAFGIVFSGCKKKSIEVAAVSTSFNETAVEKTVSPDTSEEGTTTQPEKINAADNEEKEEDQSES